MSEFLNSLTEFISFVNTDILWGIPMIVAVLGTGILITVRTRALQVRRFGYAVSNTIIPTVRNMTKKRGGKRRDGEKTISQFEAFSAAISGTVGTGNIVGVAGALLSGGPGAVFWMWVSAFFGLVTNYAENVLGIYFRRRDNSGNVSGGPMYYISGGLRAHWLAMIFSLCCLLAAVGMGMVQTNSMSGVIQNVVTGGDGTSAVTAWIVGIAVAAVTALIVIGGIKRIGRVASMIVPFMALLFIVMALTIIIVNITSVPAVFALIFTSAFSLRSVAGGFFGYMVMTGMRYGFARGVFSNEAGLGSSVIAHSASDTKEPVVQGLWGIFGVFLDTFVICTLTALSLMSCGIYDFTAISENAEAGIQQSEVAISAFLDTFGRAGSVIFAIILPLFAFTTIIAWSYYGEKAAEYLFGKRHGRAAAMVFKTVYVLLLPVGAVVSSELVWQLDDMFNAMMALPNLIALIVMSGLVARISKNYFDRRAGLDIEPMLSAYVKERETDDGGIDKN